MERLFFWSRSTSDEQEEEQGKVESLLAKSGNWGTANLVIVVFFWFYKTQQNTTRDNTCERTGGQTGLPMRKKKQALPKSTNGYKKQKRTKHRRCTL